VRYVGWILKALLFLLLLGFAVKNTAPVVVRYYLGHEWQAPLVFVLLVTFALGVALGILASMGRVFRQRRALAGKTRTSAAVDGGFEEGA
jgi:lipopolysaccharide assembly protein A